MLNPGKFRNPDLTAKGENRAQVAFRGLETLWVNTGTLCNITCQNCYIESSPENDRLVYLTVDELKASLDEARAQGAPLACVGFTGGEPFMNPHMAAMMSLALERGHEVLVLTNAMKPMMRPQVQAALAGLKPYADRIIFRVSVDHWRPSLHDAERGEGSFGVALDGMAWLSAQGFRLAVAGRLRWGDREGDMRAGFAMSTCLPNVMKAIDRPAGRFEEAGDELARVRIVVDDEHPRSGARRYQINLVVSLRPLGQRPLAPVRRPRLHRGHA